MGILGNLNSRVGQIGAKLSAGVATAAPRSKKQCKKSSCNGSRICISWYGP